MILTKHLLVRPRNHAKYWSANLGVEVGYHDEINVDLKFFPPTSSRTVICACDECGAFFTRTIQILARSNVHRCSRCARKEVARINARVQGGRSYPHKRGENHPRWRHNKSEWSQYKLKVNQITKSNDLSVLPNYDKPRGVCGVPGAYQLDHIISIKYGFDNNIDPVIIGGIDNLRFIPWEENRLKSDKVCHTIKGASAPKRIYG